MWTGSRIAEREGRAGTLIVLINLRFELMACMVSPVDAKINAVTISLLHTQALRWGLLLRVAGPLPLASLLPFSYMVGGEGGNLGA